jgi:hypothetical protein
MEQTIGCSNHFMKVVMFLPAPLCFLSKFSWGKEVRELEKIFAEDLSKTLDNKY